MIVNTLRQPMQHTANLISIGLIVCFMLLTACSGSSNNEGDQANTGAKGITTGIQFSTRDTDADDIPPGTGGTTGGTTGGPAPDGNGAAAGLAMLDPLLQPKFVNALPIPQVATANTTQYPGVDYYDLAMTEFSQDLGLIDPTTNQPLTTTVWGYGGSYPGPTIESRSTSAQNTITPGREVKVRWSSALPSRHLLPIDPTVGCGSAVGCQPFVRTVTHLHGGHTAAGSDGHPLAWFTPGFAQGGTHFDAGLNGVYSYRNDQEGTALWYHDHAMGITRLNVYAGLAGFYMIRDDNEDRLRINGLLPDQAYEIPLIIQDKSFYVDGSLAYPDAPIIDPATGASVPSIVPEFFGDFMLVNGKTWPVLDVEPRQYRFRVLNGSNSRFLKMELMVPGTRNEIKFVQIGTDGGLLDAAMRTGKMLLGPAERADIIVDFSNPALAGQTLVLNNEAKSPFPNGLLTVDPATTGQVMAFRVTKPLNVTIPDSTMARRTPLRVVPMPRLTATPGIPERELVLIEGMDDLGRLLPLLGTSAQGGLPFTAPITETPKLGTTEVWAIINATPDTHPIHQHLVQFQILDRQRFDTLTYIPGQPATLQLLGRAEAAEDEETGWKDTVRADPGEVVRIIANYDLLGEYVWHCHILEHEDHEMMRPFQVVM